GATEAGAWGEEGGGEAGVVNGCAGEEEVLVGLALADDLGVESEARVADLGCVGRGGGDESAAVGLLNKSRRGFGGASRAVKRLGGVEGAIAFGVGGRSAVGILYKFVNPCAAGTSAEGVGVGVRDKAAEFAAGGDVAGDDL